MAKRELTSSARSQEKAHTLALGDSFPEQKQNNKVKKQTFPDYLRQVARRSRIGFSKVHQELLTTHKENTMFEKRKTKCKSFRKTMTMGAKKWSRNSVVRDSVSFKSYIENTDEEDNNAIHVVSRNAVSESDAGKVADTKDVLIMEARSDQNEKSKTGAVTTNFKDNHVKATNAQIKKLPSKSEDEGAIPQMDQLSSDKTGKTGAPTRESVYDVPPPACLVRQRHVPDDTLLYDTPASTPVRNTSLQPATSNEHIYMAMDNSEQSHSDHNESKDYGNITDMNENRGECNDYVNLRSELSYTQLKQENDTTVSHPWTKNGVEYAVVNKTKDKPIECEPPEEENAYDYVPCDELVNMLVAMHTNQPHLTSNNEELESRYRNIQQLSDSQCNQQDGAYVKMSCDMASEFYSYSVEQVVDVLTACAVPELAKICEDEHLDGEYFRSITKEEMCGEPFRMQWFHICKFYRIVNGWRPKRTSSNKQ